MRTLEFLNDNPMHGYTLSKTSSGPALAWKYSSLCAEQQRKVFGGNRRPIVEFAVEDKRKWRT